MGIIGNILLCVDQWELRPFPFILGASALEASIAAVSKYGGANAGYRTMLDALIPALTVLKDVSQSLLYFFFFLDFLFSDMLMLFFFFYMNRSWMLGMIL